MLTSDEELRTAISCFRLVSVLVPALRRLLRVSPSSHYRWVTGGSWDFFQGESGKQGSHHVDGGGGWMGLGDKGPFGDGSLSLKVSEGDQRGLNNVEIPPVKRGTCIKAF